MGNPLVRQSIQGSRANESERLIHRAIQEALDAVVSEFVRDELLRAALANAGLSSLPHVGRRLYVFVEKYLYSVVVERLGEDVSGEVLSMLLPMLQMAGGDEEEISDVISRPSLQHEAPIGGTTSEFSNTLTERSTVRTQQAPIPAVLLGTQDDARARDLQFLLDTTTPIIRVSDAVDLLERAQRIGPQPLIVLDCLFPAVQPSTVAALAPELPLGAVVVLWGMDERTEKQLADLARDVENWVRCAPETTAEDVSILLTTLYGT
ncbi:MAG: hypothetical protein AAF355_06900 [Myxococcota bacterium]